MGTSIQVFPRAFDVPTFGEVLAEATRELRGFLGRFGIPLEGAVGAEWGCGPERIGAVEPDAPFVWSEERYAWFTVGGTPGGTDVHFEESAGVRRYLELEMDGGSFERRAAEVRPCVAVGRRWDFCRWGGAGAMTNVAYGVLAASVAMLTDGLLDSGDGAWDHARFPATAEEFMSWWHVPERAISEERRRWAVRCIEAVRMGFDSPNDVDV